MQAMRFLCCLWVIPAMLLGQLSQPDKLVKQKAMERLKKELGTRLNQRVGYEVDVDTYLSALNHFSNGDIQGGKAIAMEKVFSEMLGLVVGNSFAGLIAKAWQFDKWVWQSVHRWVDDEYKQRFRDEFLKPNLLKWYQEGRFGFKKVRERNFAEKVTIAFNAWCENHYEGIVAVRLFANKTKRFNQFKKEMWDALMEGIREAKLHAQMKQVAREARARLGKTLHRYEQELAGVFNQQNLTAQQVLARTRELLPKYLVTFKYPGKKIRVVLPGGPHKGDVYQFSYLFYTDTYSKKRRMPINTRSGTRNSLLPRCANSSSLFS